MKLSVYVVLLATGSAAAYSTPSRRDIRNLGSKSFTPAASRKVASSMKMEGKVIRWMFIDSKSSRDHFGEASTGCASFIVSRLFARSPH